MVGTDTDTGSSDCGALKVNSFTKRHDVDGIVVDKSRKGLDKSSMVAFEFIIETVEETFRGDTLLK